jgi:hypothetical protein
MKRIVNISFWDSGSELAAAPPRAAEPELYYNVETGTAKSTRTLSFEDIC